MGSAALGRSGTGTLRPTTVPSNMGSLPPRTLPANTSSSSISVILDRFWKRLPKQRGAWWCWTTTSQRSRRWRPPLCPLQSTEVRGGAGLGMGSRGGGAVAPTVHPRQGSLALGLAEQPGNQRGDRLPPLQLELWNRFEQRELEQEGRAILRYENELVTKLAAHAVMMHFEGETIPAVQSAVLTSQIGERLSAAHPFCLIWHDRNGRRYYSMRSRETGTDVGAIAASFGGGGHTHAAGFSVPLQPDGSVSPDSRLPRPCR